MKTYIADVNNVKPEKIAEYSKYIDGNDIAHITAHGLMREAICENTDLKIDEMDFFHGKHGKPYLKNNEIYFNISHSKNMAVCCVCNFECGIDIECKRKYKELTAKSICCENELKYIKNAKNPNDAFLYVWTRKEAYFKSMGLGINTLFKTLDTLHTNGFETIITDNYVLSTYCKSTEKREYIYK